MATQWAPGPLHSKGKITVFLFQEVLFALVVHSVTVNKYGHNKAQAQESPLEATNNAFFILGKKRSGNEFVALVTSQPLSQCVILAVH